MKKSIRTIAAALAAVFTMASAAAVSASADMYYDPITGIIYEDGYTYFDGAYYYYTALDNVYVGFDYIYGDIFYDSAIGYYAVNGRNITTLGWNFTINANPIVNPILYTNTNSAFSIPGYDYQGYSTINGGYEYQYTNVYGNRIYVGKDTGSADTAAYNFTESWTVNNRSVTYMGTNGSYYAAAWTKGGHSYSIRSDYALTSDQLTNLVYAVM